MPKIYLSPSSQPENTYAWGNTNEQEQCRRIAQATEDALLRCGFEVKTGMTGTMESRIAESNAWGADLHLPIHTNAYNGKVSGTRIFAYAKPSKSWDIALKIFDSLAPVTPGTSENIKTYPGLFELRKARNRAVYVEVDFHDVASVAEWIVKHTAEIGEAICKGCCNYYGKEYREPLPDPMYHVQIGAFRKKAYAEKYLDEVRKNYPDAFIVRY